MASRAPVVLATVGVLVAVALVLVPVEATYLASASSDTRQFEVRSCGVPVSVLLDSEPVVDVFADDIASSPPGGAEPRFGRETAPVACGAAAAKRTLLAFTLLLLITTIGWVRARRGVATGLRRTAGEDLDRPRSEARPGS